LKAAIPARSRRAPPGAPLAQDAGKPGVDSAAFAASQKMLASDVVKRGCRGEPCAGHAQPVGQLQSEPRIKRLVAFAEGHGVFADYRDDFPCSIKSSRSSQKSSVPIGLIRSSLSAASPRSRRWVCFDRSDFSPTFSAALRALAPRGYPAQLPRRPATPS